MAEKVEATGGATTSESISKTEAIRKTLKKLGNTAMPKTISEEIKKDFNLDVAPDYVSKIKADILGKSKARKPAAKKPTAKKPTATPAASATTKPATKVNNGKTPTVLMEDILRVQDLVKRVGASNLRTLIAAFEK